ncbi:MAG: citrate lyase acyl carrier protein [Lachnospirales bacterium]
MEIKREAMAGSVESNDILVKVSQGTGVTIDLESEFIKQYGDDIKEVIGETLKEYGADNVYLEATDKGALDFTIKARVITALKRASA